MKLSMSNPCFHPRTRPSGRVRRGILAAVVVLGSAQSSRAFEVFDHEDLKLNWDTTVKYSAGYRLKNPSSALSTGFQSANQDDGDSNFRRGLISNRVDVFTEADLVFKRKYGLRLSAAGWYDKAYLGNTGNPGLAGGTTPSGNQPYTQFNSAARRQNGQDAELLDAFVFANVDLGDRPASVRLGRHSLVWGESLFFGSNGIAGATGPVNVSKLVSVPAVQYKEAMLPVEQVSGQIQLNADWTLGAYYQFRWRASRLPAVGSYFSVTDVVGDGAQRLYLNPSYSIDRMSDQKARNAGQGGLQLRTQIAETDVGFYAMVFNSKTPQLVSHFGAAGPDGYYYAYHENIRLFGTSASRTFGRVNLAAEASVRFNQDLGGSSYSNDFTGNNNSNNPAYAVGKTGHVNVNMMWDVPRTFLFKEASMLAELAWNRVLSVTKNPEAISSNATRDGLAMRVLFEPTYRGVMQGLDLSVPISVGYAPKGSRSAALGATTSPENGGDFSIGLNGTYNDGWRFSLSYTHYFGAQSLALLSTSSNVTYFSYKQSQKDRDYVSFSVRRTF